MSLYSLLERPWAYQLSQFILAPGGHHFLAHKIHRLVRSLPETESYLDVGCGPASWLWKCGVHPVGVDISPDYVEAYRKAGGEARVGSATNLPFPDGSFGGVWSIGILHHLTDEEASKAVSEMTRVCRRGGYVAIVDAVLPRSCWTRPMAYGLRKMDRGRFVRTLEAHQALFHESGWQFSRFSYSLNGLECSLSILPNRALDAKMEG